MCKPTENLLLCTCEEIEKPPVHHKKSKRWIKKQGIENTEEYIWYLSRYKGRYEGDEIGSIVFPSQWLTKNISSACVLEELNKRNCFDFEYTPVEKDSLGIGIKDNYRIYLYFTYENGCWIESMPLPFDIVTVRFKKGLVQL